MEVFNILFESADIAKKKAKEVEKANIEALKKSNTEIQALMRNLSTPKKRRVLYVHDNDFPVDHRIAK